jgi:hypothetical protein
LVPPVSEIVTTPMLVGASAGTNTASACLPFYS